MKFKLFSALLAISLLFFSTQESAAQVEKYGKDSVECVKNLSLFSVYAKQDNYEDAFQPWLYCYTECPAVHKAVYVNGAKIVKYFIDKNKKNEAEFNKYVDLLMNVYDKRVIYFGSSKKYGKGYILGYKGVDFLRYRPDSLAKGYQILKESVNLQKEFSNSAVILTYVQSASFLLKKGEIKEDEMAEAFLTAVDYLEKAKETAKKADDVAEAEQAIRDVETIFTGTSAATCEKLIEIFTPRYNANKTDAALLKKIIKLLGKGDDDDNCTDAELYANAAESLYAIEPDANAASAIANYYAKRENWEKSLEYYKNAIEKEDPAQTENLATYHYKSALIYSKLNEYSNSRASALKAIEYNDKWGAPYILIATLYANSGSSVATDSDPKIKDFQRRSVYWAAVDKLIKAKSVDEDPDIQESASKLISSYSAFYPDSETAFMIGYNKGQSYRVGGWINENTTVRLK